MHQPNVFTHNVKVLTIVVIGLSGLFKVDDKLETSKDINKEFPRTRTQAKPGDGIPG